MDQTLQHRSIVLLFMNILMQLQCHTHQAELLLPALLPAAGGAAHAAACTATTANYR
jgi:hypothetical protein